jgi:protein SCO1/2
MYTMNFIRLNRFPKKSDLWPNMVKHRSSILAAFLILMFLGTGCAGQPEFKGSALAESQPAPNFQLTNQYGKAMTLQDLQDKVVVLTFLYTSCPDICPLITAKLRQVQEELGPAGSDVAVVAITVDPETDNVERVRQYSDAMGMKEQWYFLTGSREQLVPIWEAYYVAALAEELSADLAAASDPAKLAQSDSRFAGLHTAPVYLIDRHGRRRLHHSGGDLAVEDVLHDVRLLLQES